MTKTGFGEHDLSAYALVADRITLFYERYPAGRIVTELVSRVDREITFRALVFRGPEDVQPAATGKSIRSWSLASSVRRSRMEPPAPSGEIAMNPRGPSYSPISSAARARALSMAALAACWLDTEPMGTAINRSVSGARPSRARLP